MLSTLLLVLQLTADSADDGGRCFYAGDADASAAVAVQNSSDIN